MGVSILNWNISCKSSSWIVNVNWTIPAQGCLLLFASNRTTLPQTIMPPFHLPFVIKAFDLLLLTDPNGLQQSILDYTNEEQLPDVSFGIVGANASETRYFLSPTPNQLNLDNDTRLGVVRQPIFSSTRDFYTSFVLLYISSTDLNSVIRYTLNFSTPSDVIGFVYTGSILNITHTTTVRVTACRVNYLCSPVVTHTFAFVSNLISNQSFADPFESNLGLQYDLDNNKSSIMTYGFDSVYSTTELTLALSSLPNLFIVAENSLVFGAQGFYFNETLKIPASFEFIYPAENLNNIAAVCGLQALGAKHLKRSMRIDCGGLYYNATLSSAVFQTNASSPVLSASGGANSFTLRAFDYRNWASQLNTNNSLFTIERYVSLIQSQDYSQVGTRGEYHHLWLNNVYFGIYCLTENIDALFAQHFFGTTEEGDGVWSISEGWNFSNVSVSPLNVTNLTALAFSNNMPMPNADYSSIQSVLDIPSFVDFVLLQFFSGTASFIWSNMQIILKKDNSFPLVFVLGNTELAFRANVPRDYLALDSTLTSIEGPTIPSQFWNISLLNSTSISWLSRLWLKLLTNENFKVQIVDRVQTLLIVSKSPWNSSLPFFLNLANYIEPSIKAEAGRWGVNITEKSWYFANNQTTSLLSSLPLLFLLSLKSRSWISPLVAPAIIPLVASNNNATSFALLSLFEIVFGNANQLLNQSFSTTAGNMLYYFSMDGSDVRNLNNAASKHAFLYDNSKFVRVGATDLVANILTIQARSYQNGTWSAISTASFSVISTTFAFSNTFLYFNSSYDYLTPDVDANNAPIFSALLTINICPPLSSSFVFTITYSSSSSVALNIAAYGQSAIATLLSKTSQIAVSVISGAITAQFVVYVYQQSASEIDFRIDSSNGINSFLLDSRSLFFLAANSSANFTSTTAPTTQNVSGANIIAPTITALFFVLAGLIFN